MVKRLGSSRPPALVRVMMWLSSPLKLITSGLEQGFQNWGYVPLRVHMPIG